MINGNTEIIAHIGFPTHAFKAPMIYNPWFEKAGVNAIVVPMGCQTPDYPVFLRSLFKLTNIRGALITMPRKPKVAGCRSARTCCSSKSLLTSNFLGFRSPRPASSAPLLRWLVETNTICGQQAVKSFQGSLTQIAARG